MLWAETTRIVYEKNENNLNKEFKTPTYYKCSKTLHSKLLSTKYMGNEKDAQINCSDSIDAN